MSSVLLELECAYKSPRDFVKMQIILPAGLGKDLRFFLSNKFPGEGDTTGPGHTLTGKILEDLKSLTNHFRFS